MRFITGVLMGIILTVGTAYIADAMHAAPAPGDTTPQRMVNWGVVSDNLSGLSTGVQTAWAKLVGGAKEIDKKVEKSGT